MNDGTIAAYSRDEDSAQNAMAFLVFSGWAITLSYFPSGFLHFYLGSAVYARDLLLAAHLFASLVWLRRVGDMRWVLRQSAILGLAPLLLLPAMADGEYRFEALRTAKWAFSWLDWIFIGHFAFHIRRWNKLLPLFIAATMVELLVELAIGAYEWRAGHYVFSTATTWEEHTIFGVQSVKEMKLQGNIRIRGLQRDVFSFANLMAMSSVLGFAWAGVSRENWKRAAGFAWAAVFAGMLMVSGGRSALFGILASAILSGAYCIDHHFTRRWAKMYILAWVALALIISLAGVGQLTEAISGAFFGKSHLGDSSSAYMRDDNWKNLLDSFEQQPIILVIGGPFAALLDIHIAPMFHWADNQILWDAYHLGLAGALAIAFYFFRVIRIGKTRGRLRSWDVLVLFLLFVIGEGIARESLTFMGCMPLFVACGYVSAASAEAAGETSSPIPKNRSRRRSRLARHS